MEHIVSTGFVQISSPFIVSTQQILRGELFGYLFMYLCVFWCVFVCLRPSGYWEVRFPSQSTHLYCLLLAKLFLKTCIWKNAQIILLARAKSGKPVSKREKASVIALLHFYTRTPIFSPAPNSPTAVGSPGLAAQTQWKHSSSTMETQFKHTRSKV